MNKLQHLSSPETPLFNKWLATQTESTNIAWYPASGTDYMHLVHLRDHEGDLPYPDLFWFSDILPWHWYPAEDAFAFPENGNLYDDSNLRIDIIEQEAILLPELSVDQLPENLSMYGSKAGSHYGKTIFAKIEFSRNNAESFTSHMLFSICENGQLCHNLFLKQGIDIHSVIHHFYRYPEMGSGGADQGGWLNGQFEKLNTHYYITSGDQLQETKHTSSFDRDRRHYDSYSELSRGTLLTDLHSSDSIADYRYEGENFDFSIYSVSKKP